ncbi:hypothetical protein BHE74_00053139 [Ensete ventricosum]|nr:hypothetical protein BHE74_00053139 [Ensete ventricosum]
MPPLLPTSSYPAKGQLAPPPLLAAAPCGCPAASPPCGRRASSDCARRRRFYPQALLLRAPLASLAGYHGRNRPPPYRGSWPRPGRGWLALHGG